MTTHHLKLHPQWFDDVASGAKSFEYRRDDRGYAVGDTLVLREWDPTRPDGGDYTGREVTRKVTYLLDLNEKHDAEHYVVLGLESPAALALADLIRAVYGWAHGLVSGSDLEDAAMEAGKALGPTAAYPPRTLRELPLKERAEKLCAVCHQPFAVFAVSAGSVTEYRCAHHPGEPFFAKKKA